MGTEIRGLRVNMEKTKVMISGEELMIKNRVEDIHAGAVEVGVSENLVWCAECEQRCHQRCSDLRNVGRTGVGF